MFLYFIILGSRIQISFQEMVLSSTWKWFCQFVSIDCINPATRVMDEWMTTSTSTFVFCHLWVTDWELLIAVFIFLIFCSIWHDISFIDSGLFYKLMDLCWILGSLCLDLKAETRPAATRRRRLEVKSDNDETTPSFVYMTPS